MATTTESRSRTKTGTNWETADILKTPMEICWQFDYDIGIDKLKSLYSKSKRLQWDAEQQIDWDLEIDPAKPIIDEDRFGYNRVPFIQKLSKTQRESFTAHTGAHRLSQFLHGEQGALMTAAALTHAVPDYEGKLYAATQTMDEARHVEVFETYVRKLAQVYPMMPALKTLIDETLTADHWVKIAIGMNMIVEGLALGSFHNMIRATSCDLLRQILTLVLRDEARHVAFGNVYVASTIGDMHSDDREDVAQFAFDALTMMMRGTTGATTSEAKPSDGSEQADEGDQGQRRGGHDPGFLEVLTRSGIDPADFMKGMKEAREQGIRMDQNPGAIHSFKDLMMPALVRVGAVTDRTRKLYEEAGIPVFEDTTVLESMEDSETGTVAESVG